MSIEPRLMAIHAHPDDEASKGAATMAYYATIGRVRVVTCTGGERGSILNPRLVGRTDIEENMKAVRQEEMANAAEALGVEHSWLGFVDSGLPEGDPPPPVPEGSFAAIALEEAVAALVREVRSFRPHVMTTYNEVGGYPHPDHIRTHEISVAAYHAAADATQFPEAGPAWEVSKLYYDVGFSLERIEAISEEMHTRGLVSPFDDWLERAARRPRRTVTTRIRCEEYFERRDEALRAHATQIDPDGFFFEVPRDIEREVWPVEEFELAQARVPTDVPEDDLFAGVRRLVA